MYGINWEEDVADATGSKFKVGDRVRVVKDAWGETFPVGAFGTVTDVHGHGVCAAREGEKYCWFFRENQIEPAPAEQVQGCRYRVGDRVRVVKCGEENNSSLHGARVGDVFEIDGEVDSEGFLYAESDVDSWYFYPHELAPDFRPGDRVKLNRHSNLHAYGDRGTVKRVFGDNVEVRMDLRAFDSRFYTFPAEYLDWERVEDRKTVPKASAPDCAGRKVEQDNEAKQIVETLTLKIDLDTSDFTEKLGAALGVNRPSIVALTKNGQPLPAHRPHVHASVQAAIEEAERLARINPGQEFAVYQRVAGRVCEATYSMKEVA